MSAATARTEKQEKLKRLQAEYVTLMTEGQLYEKNVVIWSLVAKHSKDASLLPRIHNNATMFSKCTGKMIKLERAMYKLGEELRE